MLTYQQLTNIFTGMLFYLTHPILNTLECLIVIYCVSEDDTHRTFVVSLSDRFESFLASCIPDLHLDFFSVNINCLEFKIDP